MIFITTFIIKSHGQASINSCTRLPRPLCFRLLIFILTTSACARTSQFYINYVTVLNERGLPPLAFTSRFYRVFLMKKKSEIVSIEPQKVFAERINGWAAMIGLWAAIGAYMSSGQIIPGVI